MFGDVDGHTDGTDLITDFNVAKDSISLTGVTVSSESSVGTNPAKITLSDGTSITFASTIDLSKIKFI